MQFVIFILDTAGIEDEKGVRDTYREKVTECNLTEDLRDMKWGRFKRGEPTTRSAILHV